MKQLWKAKEHAVHVPPIDGIELGNLDIAHSLEWLTV